MASILALLTVNAFDPHIMGMFASIIITVITCGLYK